MEKASFIEWIKEHYQNNEGLLKHFVDINVDISTIMYNDISFYAYEIAQYIYNKYVTSAPIINNMVPRNLYYEYNNTSYNDTYNFVINPNRIEPIEPGIDPALLNASNEFSLRELIDVLYELGDDTPINNETVRLNIKCVYEELCESSQDSVDCCICFESKSKEEFVMFNCVHEFCKDCAKASLKSDTRPEPLCMVCRQKVTLITTRSFEICNEMTYL
jgi:hypothetical protein